MSNRRIISSRSSTNYANKDVEFQYVVRQNELEYPDWWSKERVGNWFINIGEDTLWNCYLCTAVLLGVVLVAAQLQGSYFETLDVICNVSYAVHVLGVNYLLYADARNADVNFCFIIGFLVDTFSYSHYFTSNLDYKLFCYYLRLHRPFRYLWALNDYNLKGSVLGTTLKYCYIFYILRITCALVWLNIDQLEKEYSESSQHQHRALYEVHQDRSQNSSPHSGSRASEFLSALYIINKMFIPIGPSVAPANDVERIACLLIMLCGCLVVTGAAVASLSLVISLYMRPEETFRARYRLIMKEMMESRMPASQREKVETFYKMYWHKQRAVSATQLLPTFPPTLPTIVFTDIYFEATQKSRILRDLSYHFLSELAKKMDTIHYIPGDAIIERSSRKSSIIFITYGDVEMLTAEDDSTVILRMTRGTILAPCAACPVAGCARAHLEMRAATFCTAHVLRAADLWRVALKHGKSDHQTAIILATFNVHLERVKKHYAYKIPDDAKFKSSILRFKRCLLDLMEAKDSRGNLLLARRDLFLEVAGCYIMRNRTDATLSDEADAICLRTTFPCIMQPSSSLQFAWHLFTAFLIVAVCLIHPYFIVFKKKIPLEFRLFDYVVTVIYVLDLIDHLSTGANVEEGTPITFVQTSSQQMRSNWFVLDVMGTVPIFEFIGDGHFAGINKILRLPKVFRVLKEIEEDCVYHSSAFRFFSYTLLLLLACYLIAALQQGFMCFHFGYCTVANFTHSPFWELKPHEDATIESRLKFGLYWAISMMTFTTHKETWGAQNWNNVLYTMLVLEICIVLRLFMEAVYSATIMVTTVLRENYDSCISNVKNVLIRNKVDPILRRRFITYLQLCWYTDKAYSMTNKNKSIFHDLPPHVYQDIVARQRSKYLLCIPFMKFLHKEDLRHVSTNAKIFYTSPNEILLNTGDFTNEMYVIKQGICEIISPDTQTVVGLMTVRDHFGVVISLLRLPAYYTIRAATHVQVYCISRKNLGKAMETPKIMDAINFAKEQPEYHRLLRSREPFLSYQPPEPTPNMERFKLPRKYEVDFDFLHPFTKLGFLSILRYIFPRFTIRPDGSYMHRYEWFRAFCAVSGSLIYPFYTYMVLQWPFLYYITWLLDLAAYFDIFQRMLVGYFNDNGILVYHPASTAAHYLKGAFIVDLLASLPLEYLESTRNAPFDKNRYKVTGTKQYLMLNRLIQLYRLPSAMLDLVEYVERRDILIVLKAVPLFIALTNLMTCFMVFNSAAIYYTTEAGVWVIEPYHDKGGSWLQLFANSIRFNSTESPWNLYLTTYFWIVYETSSTGYNTFNPSNCAQIDVLFVAMITSTMIITYFLVKIISIRANVNHALADFQEHLKDIVVFMNREKIGKDLQREVLNYYEYNWDKMGGVDYRNVLKLCDQITLRTDAIIHIYGSTFAKCPILSHCDASLLRMIGRPIHNAYFLRGMCVVESDDVICDMYFVASGFVNVRETKDDLSCSYKLYKGSVFGNLCGSATTRCPVSFVASSKLHLLMINSQAFHQIITDFPVVLHLLNKYTKQYSMNYIMGNTMDSVKSWNKRSLGSFKNYQSHRWLVKRLYSRESIILFYLITISLACIYLDVYNAGFQDNRFSVIVALYALDFGFCLKIVAQLLAPYLASCYELNEVLMPIRDIYFKGELQYDIISVLPLELLCLFADQNKWTIFSWLRLNRMIRIGTVYRCLKRHHERVTINLTLTTIFSVLIWFTIFVHTTTCLWYFIGVMEDSVEPNSSWIHNDKGGSWCSGLYICSLYFVLTTFTQNGVGDILPKKRSEVLFVSIFQIISTMVYMIYVGEFSNIIQYQAYRSSSFYSKYLELQEFLKNNRVSRNLVSVVNKYSLHLWRESRGIQEPYFLKTAPHCLRLQIKSAAYLHHLTKHHIFEDCEPAFLRQLVGCLQYYTYNEDMYVVKEGDITDSMYFVHRGQVLELTEAGEIAPSIYTAGKYFGVMQGLKHNLPYSHSYRTIIKSQVLTLRLDDWIYLLKHFLVSKKSIYKHFDDPGPDDNRSSFSNLYGPDSKPPKDNKKPPGMTRVSQFELDTSATTDIALSEQSSMILQTNNSPLDNSLTRNEDDSSEMPKKSQELTSIPIVESTISLAMYEENQGPKYVSETEASSPALIRLMAIKAKRLIYEESSSSVPYMSSEELAERDTLQLEEDKEATETLLKQFDEEDKRKETAKTQLLPKSNVDIARDEDGEEYMVKVDTSQSKATMDSNVQDEKSFLQSSESTALLSLEKIKNIEKTTEDEAMSTSKLNRRMVHVRYEDESNEDNRNVEENLQKVATDDNSKETKKLIGKLDLNLVQVEGSEKFEKQADNSKTENPSQQEIDEASTSFEKK